MVWDLREVPNATTGVSPYLLVYGRVPRGPLSILKEVWSGDRGVSQSLSRPVEEYLQDLRDKMETTGMLLSIPSRPRLVRSPSTTCGPATSFSGGGTSHHLGPGQRWHVSQ